MMKKLSKFTLLAAATAFLLAGVTACFTSTSDVEDETPPGSGGPSGTTDPDGTPVVVNAVWDFDKGANASTNATILAFGGATTKLSSNLTIEPDSGSGATLTIIANDKNKIKYGANGSSATEPFSTGGGIQQSAGSQEQDFAELKVDGACTVKIKAKGASTKVDATSSNINSFSINGENKFKVVIKTEFDADEHEYTYTATSAETIKITAIGMKFMSITCSQ